MIDEDLSNKWRKCMILMKSSENKSGICCKACLFVLNRIVLRNEDKRCIQE